MTYELIYNNLGGLNGRFFIKYRYINVLVESIFSHLRGKSVILAYAGRPGLLTNPQKIIKLCN